MGREERERSDERKKCILFIGWSFFRWTFYSRKEKKKTVKKIISPLQNTFRDVDKIRHREFDSELADRALCERRASVCMRERERERENSS